MGKTSACLSWEQRRRDKHGGTARELLASLETDGPAASETLAARTAFTWPCPLRPGRALFQLAHCHRVQSSPPTLHALCLRTSQFPSPPPPSPSVAISHGLVGSPGWLPAPSWPAQSPESEPLLLDAFGWFRGLGQHLPASRGLLADVACSIPLGHPEGHSLDCRGVRRLPFICSTCNPRLAVQVHCELFFFFPCLSDSIFFKVLFN